MLLSRRGQKPALISSSRAPALNAVSLVAVQPEWPAPPGVGALMSTRHGGVSGPPWHGQNLGAHVGDLPDAVATNRARWAQTLGAQPVWLDQVHGASVVRVGRADVGAAPRTADAAWTDQPGVACTVLVADCLPVLLAARDGRAVAAAHAGWRGLAGGVLETTLAALHAGAGVAPAKLVAWLGPCIGPQAFEVGADVLQAFGGFGAFGGVTESARRFVSQPRPDGSPRWLADLPGLAADRLAAAGVTHIVHSRLCTVGDASRFFSFRRDGRTGRMAASIWRR